ncbi:hypothetical protein FGO68_gene10344 [Halteria grandinella]|uniref:Uncharacterized protein n=1 Tax=Halteria grandinella TaxID=5974 RepID=A0A8J8T3Z3_HALGN|nr:hypothetical protein FGO68_gene10344 [Halteria grandinella]
MAQINFLQLGFMPVKRLSISALSNTYLIEHCRGGVQYALRQHLMEGAYKEQVLKDFKFYSHCRDPFVFPINKYVDTGSVFNYNEYYKEELPSDDLTWFTHACLGLAHLHEYDMTHGEISRDNLHVNKGIARLGKFQSHNQNFKVQTKADDVHDLGLILGDNFKDIKEIMQTSVNIQDAFRIKQIRNKIEEITEGEVLGPEIAKQVKQKMINYGVLSSPSGHTLPYDYPIDPKIYEHFKSIISDQYIKNESTTKPHESMLLQSINTHGWYRSIMYGNKICEQLPFNGDYETTQSMKLKEGVYYGQTESGKREGYGILFAVTAAGEPVLYECDWRHGDPISGRRTIETKGTYFKYEGGFEQWIDKKYDYCTVVDGYGTRYMGQWLSANQNLALVQYADGTEANGEFVDKKKHGYVTIQYPNKYCTIGKYKNDVPYGKHSYYDQKLELVSIRRYDDQGKLMRKVGVRNIIQGKIYSQLTVPINEFLHTDEYTLIEEHLNSQGFNSRWYNEDANIEDQECNVFEGYTNADGITIFSNGVYYGQLRNGQREGYGQLYTTDLNDNPHLFDCEWVQGLPTRGRLYFEMDGKLHIKEGNFENMLIKQNEYTEKKQTPESSQDDHLVINRLFER